VRYCPERALGYSLNVVGSDGSAMGVGRSKGLHLSDVLRHIRGEMGLAVDDTPLPDAPAAVKARIMGGFIFENCIERAWKELGPASRNVRRPPELLVDGIYMSPDGFCDEEFSVDEYKSTEKTRRKWDLGLQLLQDGEEAALPFEQTTIFRDHWNWFMQLMAYCLGLSTNRGNLIVWWRRGNYGKDWKDENSKADVRMYPFDFDNEELERNWTTILAHAAVVRAKEAA
jgi:hypothetical protein